MSGSGGSSVEMISDLRKIATLKEFEQSGDNVNKLIRVQANGIEKEADEFITLIIT